MLDELLKNIVHAENMVPHDPHFKVAKDCGNTITEIVEFLRHPKLVPNDEINALGDLMWDIIGNKVVATAVNEEMDRVCFGAEVLNGKQTAIVFVPSDFMQRAKDDPIYNAGAMVNIGSQIRDVWNGKIAESGVNDRAKAYEAEFLNTVKKMVPTWQPDGEYHKRLLNKFPDGLATQPELMYESEPFELGKMPPLFEVPKPERN